MSENLGRAVGEDPGQFVAEPESRACRFAAGREHNNLCELQAGSVSENTRKSLNCSLSTFAHCVLIRPLSPPRRPSLGLPIGVAVYSNYANGLVRGCRCDRLNHHRELGFDPFCIRSGVSQFPGQVLQFPSPLRRK